MKCEAVESQRGSLHVITKLKLLGTIVATGALWLLLVQPALADSKKIQVGTNKNMAAVLMTPDGPGPYPAILVLHTSKRHAIR